MKIALDPYMFRRVPLTDLPGLVADLDYQYIELSPREDFLPFFNHPRANQTQIAAFKVRGPAADPRAHRRRRPSAVLLLEPRHDQGSGALAGLRFGGRHAAPGARVDRGGIGQAPAEGRRLLRRAPR